MDSRNKENYHPALSSSFMSTSLEETRTSLAVSASAAATSMTRETHRVDMKTPRSTGPPSSTLASEGRDAQVPNAIDSSNNAEIHQHSNGRHEGLMNFVNAKRRRYSEEVTIPIENVSSKEEPITKEFSTVGTTHESSSVDQLNLETATGNDRMNKLSQAKIPSSRSPQRKLDQFQYQPLIFSQAEEMNPSRRTTMEDRCVIYPAGSWNAPDPNMIYIGIYDGHGGREIVDFLDRAMGYHVAEELAFVESDHNDKEEKHEESEVNMNDVPNRDDKVHSCASQNISMETRLVRAFLMADINSRLAGLTTSGATVAISLLKRNDANPNIVEITTANVGDSRVVLGVGDSNQVYTSKRLTYDHRVDDPYEIERIQRAGGFLFRNRVVGILAVTRSIGDHVLKDFVIAHPYVNEIQLNIMDNGNGESKQNYFNKFIIMACDGLWDVLSDEDAVSIVNSYTGKKKDVAHHLIQTALQRGTTDNVTVVVVWLSYIDTNQSD